MRNRDHKKYPCLFGTELSINKNMDNLTAWPILLDAIRTNHIVGDLIGCHSNGCVYASSKGHVIKLTRDRQEARLATWTCRNPVAQLPMVFEVWAMYRPLTDNLSNTEECFAILREDAIDVPIHCSDRFNLTLRLSPGDSRESHLVDTDRRLLAETRNLLNNLKTFLSVGDMTADNLGRTSTGLLVLRDMGSCSFLDKTKIIPEIDNWLPQDTWLGRLVPQDNFRKK